MKASLSLFSMAVIAGLAVSAAAQYDDGPIGQRLFRAHLNGYSEVPTSLSTPARGEFFAIVNSDDTAFTYWLTYAGFATPVTQAHIHFGQHHTTGGVSVWLCQGTSRETVPPAAPTDTPECAAGETFGPITETITAEDVIGPAGQGITAGEFAELLAAMRAGAAYANIHSTAFLPGEIRGQIEDWRSDRVVTQ